MKPSSIASIGVAFTLLAGCCARPNEVRWPENDYVGDANDTFCIEQITGDAYDSEMRSIKVLRAGGVEITPEREEIMLKQAEDNALKAAQKRWGNQLMKCQPGS